MDTNSSASIFPFLAPYKAKLIVSILLQITATALGLAPFIFVYLIAIALFSPPYDRAYIWQLIAAISALIQDKTLLIIAHRLSTITEAKVDSGRIVAKGTHQELLETSSLYSQMWQAHLEAQGWSFDGKEPIFVAGTYHGTSVQREIL